MTQRFKLLDCLEEKTRVPLMSNINVSKDTFKRNRKQKNAKASGEPVRKQA
jgi:hypothetical protein